MDKLSIIVEREGCSMEQNFPHMDVSLPEILEAFTVILTYLGYHNDVIDNVIKTENI